mgnify:CR=1 FL=1
MSKREAMLEQLEASPRALQALLDEEGGEALDGLSGRELERLADALATHVRTALLGARPALLSEAAQTEDDQVLLDSLDTLTAAAAVAKAIVNEPGYQVPQALLAVAEALHDIIFDLQDPRASTLQASIVELCEAWWLAERPGREELVPQTISYLLVSALHEQATTADVRRLWAVRSALGVLDYADPSVSALKKLLLHCLIKPLVLRCAEGRRLLVYFFGLHPPFIADLHRAIRAQVRLRGGGSSQGRPSACSDLYFPPLDSQYLVLIILVGGTDHRNGPSPCITAFHTMSTSLLHLD